MKDGAYFFNYEEFVTEGRDKDWFSGYYRFNSDEYPALEEKSTKNLSGLGKIIVQLTTDANSSNLKTNLGNNLLTNKVETLRSKTDIDRYMQSVDFIKDAKEKYETLNESYKNSVVSVLKKKEVDSFGVCDIGTLQVDETHLSKANIILQFVFVHSNIWVKEETSKRFPSHALYKLIVKNVSGEAYKTYTQGIFFEGERTNFLLSEPIALKTTFSIAMENLINRFLNDEDGFKFVKAAIEEEKIIRNAIPHYDSLYMLKRSYNVIHLKKQQLLFDLNDIDQKLTSIAESNKKREIAVLNRDRALDNNLMTSLIAGSSYGDWAREIRKDLEVSQKKLFILEQINFSIRSEEKRFIQEVSKTFPSSFDQSFILDTKEADDNAINFLFARLSDKKAETQQAYQNTTNTLSNDFGAVLTNNINSFFKQLDGGNKSIATPSAETSAITNAGGGINQKMDVCQQQATAEAYKSQEYSNWMRTKLHADASDYKAKMIELTLQYCSDKLPPNEVQALRQAAANERKVARELRAAKGISIRQ